MAVASDSFTGVDLSRLPFPNVEEELGFEAIYAEQLAEFQTYFPSFDATVESDPVVKIIQLSSYRELLWRQRVNEAARAVMPAYAVGSDLDNLAANLGVERYILAPGDSAKGIDPTYESDESLRRRMVLAPEGFSVAGPEGAYIYHALSANSDVLDASAFSPVPDDIQALVQAVIAANTSPAALSAEMAAALDGATWPGEVQVTVLSRTGSGEVSAEVLASVAERLSSGSVRPLTDHVTVQSAEIIEFKVDATLYFFSGPDRSVVMQTAQAQLDAHLANVHRLGIDITRAGIIAALHPEGVQNVILRSPSEDMVLTRQQAQFCTKITVLDGGVAE